MDAQSDSDGQSSVTMVSLGATTRADRRDEASSCLAERGKCQVNVIKCVPFEEDMYQVEVIVKSTARTLCTFNVPKTSVLRELKQVIVTKKKRAMMKSLCLSERRCTPEVMDISFKG